MYFETTHNFFEPANISDIAASLYGGGWRAEDRDDLISEYDFTDREADAICTQLEAYDEDEDAE